MNKRLVLILVVALGTLALDLVTKQMARKSLQGQPTVVLVKGYLDLEYHENPGAAFGLLRNVPGSRYILIGVGLLAMVMVWTMVRRLGSDQRAATVAFALVAGGAVGNLIDRVYLGRVVDFIVMHWNRKYVWPAYNVADIALVAGVILLLLVLSKKPPEAAPAPPARGKKRGRRGR